MASKTSDAHTEGLLRIGDTCLVLAQRLSELVASGPTLEEELALANIALDLLGQGTLVLEHAGTIEGAGRSADDLAYLRDAGEWRNALIAELENGDFARTMLRLFLYSAYAVELWDDLSSSSDRELAAIAGKAFKEATYHLRHAAEWVIRLADGTEESTDRIDAALAALWPYTGELFLADDIDDELAASGVIPERGRRSRWDDTVAGVFAEGRFDPPNDPWMQRGGRQGRHTEALGFLLAEMQFLQRAYPGASW